MMYYDYASHYKYYLIFVLDKFVVKSSFIEGLENISYLFIIHFTEKILIKGKLVS